MEASSLLSSPCSVTNSSPLLPKKANFLLSSTPNRLIRIRCFSTRRRSSSQYWDSNAESIRTDTFKFKFGEEPAEDDDDDDDADADMGFRGREKKRSWWSRNSSDDIDQGSGGIWEEAIDSIWIFKVFSSFGWMLPFIIISMLVASGPKAFLMALAIPLGQSALSLAIDKVWGRTRDRPRSRSRTKKKPFSREASNVETSKETSGTSEERRGGYQSWTMTNNGSGEKKGSQSRSSFGGWDELESRGGSSKGPTRKPSRSTGGPPKSQVEKKGKLSSRVTHRDTPLLLRLLIAVFPFLGSWIKIL